MNSIQAEKIENKTEAGGGLWAAARFWLALAGFGLIALGVSYVLLATRDTLLPLIPADAVVYLHTQEEFGLDLITSSSSVDLTAFTGIKEAAAYAQQSDYDSELAWTVLLRWPFYAPPSQTMATELSAAGFNRINRTTFIQVKPENPTASESGLLSEDRTTTKALTLIRTLAKTQAYIGMLDESANDPENPWVVTIQKTPFVLGLFDRPNHNFTTTLLPINLANDFLPFFGPGLPTVATNEPLTPSPFVYSPTNTISFSTLETDLNLLPLLFGETELARQTLGVPDSDQLDIAKKNLMDLLDGPISVLLTSKTDLNENQIGSLVAYFPETKPDDLKTAVSYYLKTSFPEKEGLELPDQSFWPEFFAPNLNQASPTDDLGLYQITPWGVGSIFSNEPNLLEEVISHSNEKQPTSCLGVDSFESISINRTTIFPWSDLKFLNFSIKDEAKPIIIQRIGDNITHICG
ncbi:TPA: hypothetical protein DEP86_03950 [Candidatus Uhrbacteria bacterium]|nr:hypothetical protein [Candidatus Uhrbacteria bacterium]